MPPVSKMRRALRQVAGRVAQLSPMARRMTVFYTRTRLALLGYLFERSNRQHTVFSTNVAGVDLAFSTEDPYSRLWFYGPIAGGGVYEPQVTKLLVERLNGSRCFADVGANLGYYSCLASRLLPAGRVFAFEMDDHNCSLLERNLRLNDCVNVTVVQAAVTDTLGAATYVRRPSGRANRFWGLGLASPPRSRSDEVVKVPTTTLDAYFAHQRLEPDIVKIDVEGAEYKVLQGMRGLLGRGGIILIVEVHLRKLMAFGASVRDVLALLLGHGFQIFEIEHSRHAGALSLRRIGLSNSFTHNIHIFAHR